MRFIQLLAHRAKGIPVSPRELNLSLQMLSILRSEGWQKSVRARRPIDKNGDALPWYTYSAIQWLGPRLRKSDAIFEYGIGNSTIWYGQKVGRVVAVEHNHDWFSIVSAKVGTNVTIQHIDTLTYADSLKEHPLESFDLISVDGINRLECAKVAPSRLRQNGLIVLDNSDRAEQRPAIEYLHSAGFSRIDFGGLCPQEGVPAMTSVFGKFSDRWISENIPITPNPW